MLACLVVNDLGHEARMAEKLKAESECVSRDIKSQRQPLETF